MDSKIEAKRITRWLESADISAEKIGGKLVATAHEDNTEIDHYITNLKWCVRECRRIAAAGGGQVYTKRVGGYCAVYAHLTVKEQTELRNTEITEAEVKEMIAADKKRAA